MDREEAKVNSTPRTIWVACATDPDTISNLTWMTEDACNSAYPGDGWKAVKFVEVIE